MGVCALYVFAGYGETHRLGRIDDGFRSAIKLAQIA